MSFLPELAGDAAEKALVNLASEKSSSALSNILSKKLIGNEAIKATTNAVAKNVANNTAKKLAIKAIENNAVDIPIRTGDMNLQEAYERMASARNASQSNANYGVDSGVIDFTNLSKKKNPYVYDLYNNYRNNVKSTLGSAFEDFEPMVMEYTKIHPDEKSFEAAKKAMEKYLNSSKADTVVQKSQELLPNAGVYRATWPDKPGISWSVSPNIANSNMEAGKKMLEGEILGNERVIAPQFTELYQPATSQLEVIGNPSLQKEVSQEKLDNLVTPWVEKATKGKGNWGHSGRKGMIGGSAPKLDQDTIDLIETLRSVGAEVDDYGNVTVYHRTTPENADKIYSSGKMFGKEANGELYFSTNRDFQPGYGEGVVKLSIPANKLSLDDLFDSNADLKLITGKANTLADIKKYLRR